MWLQKWTFDFKPEEDSPIVSVLALIPRLPFRCHTWNYVKYILGPIGTPHTTADCRIRPSPAKVRVEVDLTKSLLQIESEGESQSIVNSVRFLDIIKCNAGC